MDSYDVIIVGTGAGGGTLARHLAPSGKRILLLERGDWLPREPANISAEEVFVNGRYISPDTWRHDDGEEFQPQIHYNVGGATKFYGAALYRLREEDFGELKHHDGISPAWPISYSEIEPYYTLAEQRYCVHGDARRGPHRAAQQRSVSVPGRVARTPDPEVVGRPRRARATPVPCPVRRAPERERPAEQRVHALPELRRLPLHRPRQVRRRCPRGQARARAFERRAHDQCTGRAPRDQ